MNESGGCDIWGIWADPAVSIHVIAERWHQTPTKVTPQVPQVLRRHFLSSSCLSLITFSPHRHSSSLSVHLHHFFPHHLFFFSSVKWSVGPGWSPDQPPPLPPSICQSCLVSCLPWLFSVSLILKVICLFSCHLAFLFLLPVYSLCSSPFSFP